MNAAEITRQSGSNLALAFFSLGKERRADISVFYAFCRLIDDLVDSTEISLAEKRRGLDTWRKALTGPAQGESPLAENVRVLLAKYSLPPAMLGEVIDGVEMDLTIATYATFDDLRLYCYRVASAVGLVSIEIFGCKHPGSREYAVELGLALQLTNIIRDVGKDLTFNRVYLPQEDLVRSDYSEAKLRARTYDQHFVELMKFEAARAWTFFHRAAELQPREDRRALLPANLMATIYAALLSKIEADGFRVFSKNYRLGRLAKMSKLASGLLNFR